MAKNQFKELYDFSDNELKLNNAGKVSKKQRVKIETMKKAPSSNNMCVFIMIGIVITLYIIIYFTIGQLLGTVSIVAFSIVFGTILIFIIVCNFRGESIYRDMDPDDIMSIIGNPNKFKEELQGADKKIITIFHVKFEDLDIRCKDKKEYDAFHKKRKYRVNYVGRPTFDRHLILSVQKLEKMNVEK